MEVFLRWKVEIKISIIDIMFIRYFKLGWVIVL